MTLLNMFGDTKGTAKKASPYVAGFLLLWWAAGVGTNTFWSPFMSACNGYINGYCATWISFIGSCAYVFAEISQAKSIADSMKLSSSLGLLLLGAVTVMVQASFDCSKGGCSTNEALALSGGAFSMLVCVLLLFITQCQACIKWVALLLCLGWLAAVSTLTYNYSGEDDFGLYSSAANGFFGTWLAFFAALALCHEGWIGGDVDYTDPRVVIGIIFFGSLFEMWAAGSLCDSMNHCSDEYAWAVAVGIISMVICVVVAIMLRCCAGAAKTANPVFAILLVLLWLAGVGVLTIAKPFPQPCTSLKGHSAANGYFGAWIALIASWTYLSKVVPRVAQLADDAASTLGLYTFMLVWASITLMVQSSYDCDHTKCQDTLAWAVACSVISLVICLLLALVKQIAAYAKWVALFLSLWWGCAVATLTFQYDGNSDTIYASAGNGFFAIWAAFFIASIMCYEAFFGKSLWDGESGSGASFSKGHPRDEESLLDGEERRA